MLAVYVGGILHPWIQIATGYQPIANPGATAIESPVDYAVALSLSIAAYGFMFAVPLLIGSLYTIRKLRTRYTNKFSRD